MSELYDLFGSGNDESVRELAGSLAEKERRWKELTRGLKEFYMPDSYKNAVENIEYGFERDGTLYQPVPFMRVAGKRYQKKWDKKIEEAAARFVIEDDEKLIKKLEDEVRFDFYETALENGVPKNVAEVFSLKFKKNYRGVQMCEWVHGNSKNPREYHERKWDGHTGKINGRPNGLDGYIFPVDKPPVIGWEKNGKEIRGFPGDLPNCSCLLVPVFV